MTNITNITNITTNEALLRLMCLPTSLYAGVVRTSDGFYIGQTHGDIGYNHLIGSPSKPHEGPGRDQMLSVWASLSDDEKVAVVRLASSPTDGVPIPLERDFGVPIESWTAAYNATKEKRFNR